MSKLGKYGKTFGFIFGASFLVSGVNSVIASNTDVPSIATYSVTQDFAERIVGVFGGPQVSAMAVKSPETGIVMATSVQEANAGS